MDVYLQAVLRGAIDSDEALRWAASDAATPAPGVHLVSKSADTGSTPSVWSRAPSQPFTPPQFRAYLLDYVRRQSSGVLAAGRASRRREAGEHDSCISSIQRSAARSLSHVSGRNAAAGNISSAAQTKAAVPAPEAFPPLGAPANKVGGRRAMARRITPTPSSPRPPPPVQQASVFEPPIWQPQTAAWPASAGPTPALSSALSTASSFSAVSIGAPPLTPQAVTRHSSPFTTTVLVGAPPDELVPASPGVAVSPQISNLERLFSGANVGDRVSPATRRPNGLSSDGPSAIAPALFQRLDGLKSAQQGLSLRAQQEERPGPDVNQINGKASAVHNDLATPAAATPNAVSVSGSVVVTPPAAVPKPRHRIRPQPVQLPQPVVPAPQWGQSTFGQPSSGPPGARSLHDNGTAAEALSTSFDSEPLPQHSPKKARSAVPQVVPAPEGTQAIGCEERSKLARALGRLHGGLLLHSSAALAPELELLLRLLSLPAGCEATGETSPLLGDTASAAQFASSSLLSAGGVLESLGWDLLHSLAAAPAVLQHAGQLQERIKAALDAADRHPTCHVSDGSLSQLVQGLSTLTSDRRLGRTEEEQRLITNREAARDDLFELLHSAVSISNPSDLSDIAAIASVADDIAPGVGEMATLMRARASPLIRQLLIGNFEAFTQIFTAAILQAAVTGEVVLDAALARLSLTDSRASQRIRALDQRMRASGYHAPATSKPTKGGSGVAAAAVWDAQTAMLCPPHLRPHALLLQAADSHCLNAHLQRHMAAKLGELCHHSSARAPASKRAALQLLQQTLALATFLSLLTFAFAEGSKGRAAPTFVAGPLDVRAAVALAAQQGGAALVLTVPWAVAYTTFLPRDIAAVGSQYFRHVRGQLVALLAAPGLSANSPLFGTAAVLLRCCLEDGVSRLPPPPQQQWQEQHQPPQSHMQAPAQRAPNVRPSPQQSGVARPQVQLTARAAGSQTVAAKVGPAIFSADQLAQLASELRAADAWVDSDVLQLCCAPLSRAATAVQTAAGGRTKVAGGAAALAANPLAPARVVESGRAAASDLRPGSATSPAAAGRRRLQEAFLDVHSGDDAVVKLRWIVECNAEILGVNRAAAEEAACLRVAADAATLELAAEAATLQCASSLGDASAEMLTAAARRLAVEHTFQAVQAGAVARAQQLESCSARAMLLLAGPQLSDDVASTAAAILAERAAEHCCCRLRSQVHSHILRELLQQVAMVTKKAGISR